MDAYIKGISYYLPPLKLTNEMLNEEFPEWSVDKISKKTGIYERGIADEEVCASDMAVNATNNLFDEYNIDPSTVDFLIYCTQSPDYVLPTTACMLQDRLGLRNDIGALDINLGCSGFVYGLSLVQGLVKSGAAKEILLITSDTYSKFIKKDDKSNRTIFGDGASATLISGVTGFAKIKSFVFGTDGSGYDKLIVNNSGCRKDLNNPESALYMDGKAIFEFTAEKVPLLIKDVLLKNSLKQDDIDMFVFHQANKYMLNFIRKKVGIDQEKFYVNIEGKGNTVSSTIPIALKDASDKINNGDKVLLAGFGVGLSLAGCVIEYV